MLENTLATEKTAGLVKLSDSTTVTDSTGLALPASEKNAAAEGSLANSILLAKSELNESVLNKVRFLGKIRILDSELGNVAVEHGIPDYMIYILVQSPAPGESYIQGGGAHIVMGMEYGTHKYGAQLSLGAIQLKTRNLMNGVWGEWKTMQTV